MTTSRTPYPVRIDAAAEPVASRGLWLVKWLLLIPHFVVLAFLWLAFTVVSVIALFAILFTGRYPRALFDFTVGVLRWSWRVHYYGYGALGTDRYPPFTLADVPDYPAYLDVAYPERLSRGLVLVKWWLLALPHYLVVALFVGGGIWFGTTGVDRDGVWDTSWGAGGLVALLVFVAGVVLLVTGSYPRPLYDFILGMDRWVLRVAAYAALMTDEYPPFRLDAGGPDPGSPTVGPAGSAQSGSTVAEPPRAPVPPVAPWTSGRVVALVAGVLLLLGAGGTLVGGGSLLWADRTQRVGDFLMTAEAQVDTDRYAVISEPFHLEGAGLDWAVDEVVGDVRFEAAPVDRGEQLFIGVARTADAEAYLTDVGYAELGELHGRFGGREPAVFVTIERPGGAPARAPTQAGIWVASAGGPGSQELTWRPADGDWTVVVMRADGAPGVSALVRAGATVPGLGWLIAGLFTAGAVLLALGGLCIGLAVPPRVPPDGVPVRDRSTVPPDEVSLR